MLSKVTGGESVEFIEEVQCYKIEKKVKFNKFIKSVHCILI